MPRQDVLDPYANAFVDALAEGFKHYCDEQIANLREEMRQERDQELRAFVSALVAEFKK
jgi:hypothetical protein